jgi:DNA replication protein DnaC
VDLEAAGQAFLAGALRKTREQAVRAFFGPVLLETDWARPDVARNAAKAARVAGWQMGPRGWLLYGPSGGGKTRALAQLIWRLHVEESVGVGLWNAQELFAEITRHQMFGRDETQGFIEALAVRPVLVVEDLGQEATSRGAEQVARQWFFRLLDLRVANGRPVMLTTNHTATTLAEDARMVSADPLLRRLRDVAEPVYFHEPGKERAP